MHLKTNKMKNLYLTGLLLISMNIMAQNNYTGLKAGFSTTWYTGPGADYWPQSTSIYSSRTFATGGLNFETFISKHFLLGIELLYESSGFKSETNIDWQAGDPYILINKFRFNQLSLPLIIGAGFGKDLYGNIHAGFVPALLFNPEREETKVEQGGGLIGTGTANVEVNNPFDFGYLVGGNIGYKLSNRSKIQATVRYQGNISKRVLDEYVYHEDYRYRGVSVTAGYLYALTPAFTGITDPVARENLLAKSRRMKRTGKTLMITGGALGIVGGIFQYVHEVNSQGFLDIDMTGATIAIAGGALLTTGLVINIRANGLRQKATENSGL